MQCGTPSVTTAIGSEAMHANLPWNGFVENDASEFAKKQLHFIRMKTFGKKLRKTELQLSMNVIRKINIQLN